MSALSALNPTLIDLASRLDPNDKISAIVEVLNQDNPILQHMPFVEANELTGHQTTARTGLPTPVWRKIYGFVPPSKSTTTKVRDSMGMLESYAEVDKALADLNGNTSEFRLSENVAFLEAMAQEMASTLFYGDESTEPEAFTGFAPRFNALTGTNADNIVTGGGTTGNQASIWLINWDRRYCHGIYPKGSKLGIQMTDKGQVTKESADGLAEMYRTHYRWDCGLSVKDWRGVVRVPNIQIADLSTLANCKNLVTWMTQATERIHSTGGRPVFYMPRLLREKLRLGIIEKVSSNLTFETVAGKPVMMFDGIPVERCDALLTTESVIS